MNINMYHLQIVQEVKIIVNMLYNKLTRIELKYGTPRESGAVEREGTGRGIRGGRGGRDGRGPGGGRDGRGSGRFDGRGSAPGRGSDRGLSSSADGASTVMSQAEVKRGHPSTDVGTAASSSTSLPLAESTTRNSATGRRVEIVPSYPVAAAGRGRGGGRGPGPNQPPPPPPPESSMTARAISGAMNAGSTSGSTDKTNLQSSKATKFESVPHDAQKKGTTSAVPQKIHNQPQVSETTNDHTKGISKKSAPKDHSKAAASDAEAKVASSKSSSAPGVIARPTRDRQTPVNDHSPQASASLSATSGAGTGDATDKSAALLAAIGHTGSGGGMPHSGGGPGVSPPPGFLGGGASTQSSNDNAPSPPLPKRQSSRRRSGGTMESAGAGSGPGGVTEALEQLQLESRESTSAGMR